MPGNVTARPIAWTRRLAETYWRGAFDAVTPAARGQAEIAGVALAAIGLRLPAGSSIIDLGGRRAELLQMAVTAGFRTSRLDLVARCTPLPPALTSHVLFEGELDDVLEDAFDGAIALDLPAQLLDEEFASFLDLVGTILRRSGIFAFVVPNSEQLEQHVAIDPISGVMFHPHQRVRSFNPGSVESWLKEAGFAVSGLHQIDIGRLGFASGSQPLAMIAGNDSSYSGNGSSLLVIASKEARVGWDATERAKALLRGMRNEARLATEPPAPRRVDWDQPRIDAFWSRVAGSPLDDLSFARHNGSALLRTVEAWLKPGGRHIDIGAGHGDFIEILARHGHQAAAFEPAEGRRTSLDMKLAGLPNYLGSWERPDPGQPFDVAFAFEVVEHIPTEGLDSFFVLVREFLAEDGVLILSTPCCEDLDASEIYSPVSGAVFHRWQHVQQWTPDRLRVTLEAAGFDVEVIHQLDFYGIGQGRHPHYEALLVSRESLVVGDGSNLVCVARKAAQPVAPTPTGSSNIVAGAT
jgi:hypothetical protein